jgi:hypothetical protein
VKRHRAGGRRGSLGAALTALALPAAAGADPAAAVPQSALQACAAIAAASERLGCYDQLSGRDARSTAGVVPAAAAPVTAAPATAAPATMTSAAAAAPAAPASSAAPVPPPRESFGLYAVEHPTAPLAPSLQARVISVATGSSGRMTVELEPGQLWELEDADPLLAAGDTVSIRRASLGSFLMETPTRRTHRVRRLR